MAASNDPRSLPRDGEEPERDPSLQDEWGRESRRTINESALRDRPEWVKSIGDEDEDPARIERNLQDYGWELLGEDDFVSDPTAASDAPGWVDDDYDDEDPPRMKNEEDLADGETALDEDQLYSD